MKRILLALLLVASVAGAQNITGVAGDMGHGDNMVISGSGFGTKSPVAPMLWENFENGVAGDTLGVHSDWQPFSARMTPIYNDGGATYNGSMTFTPYSGSLCATNRASGDNAPGQNYDRGGSSTGIWYFPTYADTVYYSYVAMITAENDESPYLQSQWKAGRVQAEGEIYTGVGSVKVSSYIVGAASGMLTLFSMGSGEDDWGSYLTNNPPLSTWQRHELFRKNSVPAGTANGEYHLTLSRPGYYRYVEENPTGMVNKQTGETWKEWAVSLPL